MKLGNGHHTFNVTTGGTTVVSGIVSMQGMKLNLGTETYTWNEAAEMYVADHVAAAIDPKSDGTFTGYTGTPPNVYAYGGTYT